VLSASSYSSESSVHRSGGFFSSIGDGILKADDAMNRMLNRSQVSAVGKTFDKMGLGPVHLCMDLCGYAAFKCMEGVGRMLGGKGSVDYHFDKEWGAGKSASACNMSGASAAARADSWSHTRSQLDIAAHGRDGVSRSGCAHEGWRTASSVDLGAVRYGASARDGAYRSTTTHTHLGADGSFAQSTTTTRIGLANTAARPGWADAGVGMPMQSAGERAATDAAAWHLAHALAVHARPIAPGFAAQSSALSMEIRYA